MQENTDTDLLMYSAFQMKVLCGSQTLIKSLQASEWFTKAVGVVFSGFTLGDRKISRGEVNWPSSQAGPGRAGGRHPL